MTRSFSDTSVLVYLIGKGEPEKKARARGVIGLPVVSTQVLQVSYASLTRRVSYPLSPEVAGAG